MSLSAAAVCFIVCHGGPADHFATFAEELAKKGQCVEIYASGPALKKLQERHMEVKQFCLDDLCAEKEDDLALEIAKACSSASIVMTDLGHAFDIKLQKALSVQAPEAVRLTYYDNPEPYVPGGYSEVAAQVMLLAQRVLFANAHLAEDPVFKEPGQQVIFEAQKKIGVGYYPIDQALTLAKQRSENHLSKRAELFAKNGLEDLGQKILVYFGGNNTAYFDQAFPAFLSLLEQGSARSDLSNLVIILQQHPGAQKENRDKKLIESWAAEHSSHNAPKIIVSDFPSSQAQIVADGAFYYQTSMGPQFVLAGIPTIQIGHEPYEDILVKNGLSPSVTDATELLSVLESLDTKKQGPQGTVIEKLGINEDWFQILAQKALRL